MIYRVWRKYAHNVCQSRLPYEVLKFGEEASVIRSSYMYCPFLVPLHLPTAKAQNMSMADSRWERTIRNRSGKPSRQSVSPHHKRTSQNLSPRTFQPSQLRTRGAATLLVLAPKYINIYTIYSVNPEKGL